MKRITLLLMLALLAASCSVQRQNNTVTYESPDDEMVNMGYGRVRRQNVNGAVSRVKVENAQTYSNMYEYLQGKVPGLYVDGNRIRIRGIGTNSDSYEPLILVDDVEMSDLSGLNPIDVDSVEVLKDAASASIYGVRGANGVILITTKGAASSRRDD